MRILRKIKSWYWRNFKGISESEIVWWNEKVECETFKDFDNPEYHLIGEYWDGVYESSFVHDEEITRKVMTRKEAEEKGIQVCECCFPNIRPKSN